MRVYRITKTKYTDPLDAKGAELYGARWNSRGIPMLYTASSEALAILEMRVHAKLPGERRIFSIDVPDDSVQDLAGLGLKLPSDWSSRPPSTSTMNLGDAWSKALTSLGLKVPSAVSPGDWNVLINPLHSGFKEITVTGDKVQSMDERLWENP